MGYAGDLSRIEKTVRISSWGLLEQTVAMLLLKRDMVSGVSGSMKMLYIMFTP